MTKLTVKKGEAVPRETRQHNPLESMDRLFDQMWEGGFISPFRSLWPEWHVFRDFDSGVPKVDVVDREKDVLVRAEIPGISKEQLNLTISDDYLTITAEEHEESKEEGEYFRSEIRHGSFTRTVHLPTEVDGTKAEAKFKDGMLEVTVPKVKEAIKHKVYIR